jgi:adenine-specific DNA-methyltransferase
MRVPQHISDPISENLAKLAELFPAAVKDGALDVEALRAELGEFEEIKPGDETYELNWVGKQAAKKGAFKPLLGKTLALKDDGKNSDKTQNLYIEGDNLEALKLLRQNYYGEVKMIYIDPPYNTGKDFVYTDKFAVRAEETEQEEGMVSDEGRRLIKNEKSSNRFHARWLDMIYPRLRIAKDLLREDGIIFISIDDNEVSNLRGICDEIFYEENFIAAVIWEKMYTTKNDSSLVSGCHETILIYSKNISKRGIGMLPRSAEMDARYSNPDNDPRGKWKAIPMYADGERKNGRFLITSPTGKQHEPEPNSHWRYNEKDVLELIADNRVWFGKTGDSQPNLKRFLSEVQDGVKAKTLWFHKDVGSNDSATREIKELFDGSSPFSFPKPSSLIMRILKLGSYSQDDLILDFFSGSATTAQAVMLSNSEDGGNRRYIMVQIPEVCDEESDAAKTGYKTIAEIGKERIRRAGEKIKGELKIKQDQWIKQQALESKNGSKLDLEGDTTEETNPYVINPDSLDIGFKSFRIEDTKINWLKKDLRGEQLEFDDTTTQDALDFVPGYTDIDVVYELMLRQSNIPLTGTITKPIAIAKRTYLYADAYLICLEETITQKLVESLAAIEPTPNKYFFRDSAFGTDIALKDETFRRLKAEIHKHHGDLGAAYTVEFI